jgi:hypothetical protein
MLCSRCEQQGDRRAAHRPIWAAPERLHRVLCRRCGAVLPAEDQGERLLDKLSQLARFGLVAEATLLTPSHRDV